MFALSDHLYTLRHQTFGSHRAVIGHDDNLVAGGGQFIVQDDKVFVTCGKHGDNLVAGTLECLGNRQHRCSAYTAAGANDCAVVLDTRSLTERAYHIRQAVAGVHGAELGRRHAYALYDQGDGAGLSIGIRYGERHTLGVLVHANDDEVSGTTTSGNERSFHYKLRYIVRKETFRDDLVHYFQD